MNRWYERRGTLRVVGLAVVFAVLSAVNASTATAVWYDVDATVAAEVELSPPSARFAAAANSDDTGFPAEDVGFSAYLQVPATTDSTGNANTSPRLDVVATALALETPPPASDPIRAGAGTVVGLGSNFAIVTLPLRPALDQLLPPTNVNVYFDDQGWVIGYLPAGHPAAAIWRYSSARAANDDEYDSNADLANNLLVLAINATLSAANANPDTVTSAMVSYFDWEHPDCDAYVLFSNSAIGTDSHPVRFLVPSAIKRVHASAAVLMTSPPEGGSADSADLMVDGQAIATVGSGRPALAATNFNLVWYVGMRQTDPTWVEENRGPAWSSHPILIEPEQLPGPIAPASCKEGPTRKGRRSHRRYRWKENRDS